MSNHYYTKNDNVLHSKPKNVSVEINGTKLTFKTDSGVFSKNRVDFGTMVLLENIVINPNSKRVVDIGCGYGAIGITIAKLHKSTSVYMIDVNDRAVKLARENIKLNGVENADVIESYLFNDFNEGNIDVILSNPPIRAGKKVVFEIIEEAYNRLKGDGKLWFVIQKKQGAASSITKMEELFNVVEIVETKKGYVIIKAVK